MPGVDDAPAGRAAQRRARRRRGQAQVVDGERRRGRPSAAGFPRGRVTGAAAGRRAHSGVPCSNAAVRAAPPAAARSTPADVEAHGPARRAEPSRPRSADTRSAAEPLDLGDPDRPPLGRRRTGRRRARAAPRSGSVAPAPAAAASRARRRHRQAPASSPPGHADAHAASAVRTGLDAGSQRQRLMTRGRGGVLHCSQAGAPRAVVADPRGAPGRRRARLEARHRGWPSNRLEEVAPDGAVIAGEAIERVVGRLRERVDPGRGA